MTATTSAVFWWHWLFHQWGQWEQYEQNYLVAIYPGELIQQEVSRKRLREKRRCLVCGAAQDRIVTEYHGAARHDF
jgi:hypothetical protein